MESDFNYPNPLSFISKTTIKMAIFFNSLTEMCLKDISKLTPSKQHPLKENAIDNQSESSQDSYKSDKKQEDNIHKRKIKTRLHIGSEEVKPKAPTSSFLLYYHENKKKLSQTFKETNVSRLTKIASQCWKDLPEEQKQIYISQSEATKTRYQEEMVNYKQKYAIEIEEALKKRRALYRNNWMVKKKAQEDKDRAEKEKNEDRDDSNLSFSSDEDNQLIPFKHMHKLECQLLNDSRE